MKQQFSDTGQQTKQICDPWENENKQDKPYDHPDSMSGGIIQTVEKGGGPKQSSEDLQSWGEETEMWVQRIWELSPREDGAL